MPVWSLHERSPLSGENTLGSFNLISKLASSEIAVLYCARAALTSDPAHAPFVIKRLHPKQAADEELRSLFLRSGTLASKLESEHVMRVLEVHAEPEPFLVMERLAGANLEALLAARSGKDVTRYVVPIVVDALCGLRALHEARDETGEAAPLVHCAPSARHLFVGTDGVARVLDLTHAVGAALPWSASRDARLSAAEMAPEQALAPAHLDPRCDLFILGTTLWQALTSRPLFAAESVHATLQNMLRMIIPSPSDAGAPSGNVFDHVCFRALQRARGQRYESAAEMAFELKEAAERAQLYASREEIGAWVRSLVSPEVPQERAVSGRRTLLGFGPVTAHVSGSPESRPSATTPNAKLDELSAPQRLSWTTLENAAAKLTCADPDTQEDSDWKLPQRSVMAPPMSRRMTRDVFVGIASVAAAAELALVLTSGAFGYQSPPPPPLGPSAVHAAAPEVETDALGAAGTPTQSPLPQAQSPRADLDEPAVRATRQREPPANPSPPARSQTSARDTHTVRSASVPARQTTPSVRPAPSGSPQEAVAPPRATGERAPLPRNPY